MSTTQPVNGVTQPAASGASAPTGYAASGIPSNMNITEAGFLQLISAQMTNQNPLSPADPTQFLTQIEGLSQVSSLQSVQNSMSTLASSLQAAQVLSGTSLLGRSVLAPGSTGTLTAAGGTLNGAATAPAGASTLNVAVTDASGAVVTSFQVPAQSSGYTNFTWNGQTSTGAAAPPGAYTFNITASIGPLTESVSPLVYSTVNSVTMDPTTNTLQLNTLNGALPLSSVVSIQ